MTNHAPKWPPNISLSPSMVCSGLLTWNRPQRRPKEANSDSLFLVELATHDAHFKPTVGMLTNQTKGHDLAPLKTRCPYFTSYKQGCQSRFVPPGMTETFRTNSKNGTKWNKFHLILNLGLFRIFRLNSARNVPVSFHMFCSVLEKPLNQIEPAQFH